MNQTSLSAHYSILQIDKNSWCAKPHVQGYKGRIRRIQLVVVEGHTNPRQKTVGHLLCSCRYFKRKRTGLPCRRLIALVKEVQPYHCDFRWNKELFHYQRIDNVTLMVEQFMKLPPMQGPEVTSDDIQCYLAPSVVPFF